MKKTRKLSRREFVKLTTIASASLPIAIGGYPMFASEKPKTFEFNTDNDNVLVLIQLQGGNDGLNTVFNMNQYSNLQSVRSNIIIPEGDLLDLDGTTKLHSSMNGMQEIWNNENLGIIQNVGYPNQNRSHFRSTDIWNSASDANDYVSSGWIGRFFDTRYETFPTGYPDAENPHPFAITIGKIVSETCQGVSANFSMALTDPGNPGTALISNMGEIPNDCYGDALTFVNETISQTNAYADVILNASNAGNNLSTKYTTSETRELEDKLKIVAKLISGGLQTKVFVVELGGFDTHDNQVIDGDVTTGNHATLLEELSDAMNAFQDDLELLGIDNKVIGMTYSEFGRRIRSNDAFGTDHGNAAPLFLFGSCVKNNILGDAPEIDTLVDTNEGVQMQFDFRNIYSSILTNWLGATETETSTVLFDTFDTLPLFKDGCSAVLNTNNFILNERFSLDVYPNPSLDFVNIRFNGNNQNIKMSLYNSIGVVVKQITNSNYSFKQHVLNIDIRNLPKGTYFVHCQTKGSVKTKKLLKY
jgi:uncharacterized protein (DUF1501 family)